MYMYIYTYSTLYSTCRLVTCERNEEKIRTDFDDIDLCGFIIIAGEILVLRRTRTGMIFNRKCQIKESYSDWALSSIFK